MSDAARLSRREKVWIAAAAIPFLVSLALLGYAVSNRFAYVFAIGWPVLQVFGYVGALRFSKARIDHPLVHAQVVMHWLVLVLLAAMIARGA